MATTSASTRRQFLLTGTATGTGLLVAGIIATTQAGEDPKVPPQKGDDTHAPEEISPAEDLMREHGVLNRILLIYEESGGGV